MQQHLSIRSSLRNSSVFVAPKVLRLGRNLRRCAFALSLAISPALTPALTPALALGLAALSTPATSVQAQGLFSPAITVNEDVITGYELQQRARFLELTGLSSEPQSDAREELILDALRRRTLREVGISASEEEINEGLARLAQRAGMSSEQFLTGMVQAGVSRETLRDYAAISLAWNQYVTARFLGAARPDDAEIDRALGQSSTGSVQVLLAEVIMPITPETATQVEDLAVQIAEIRDPQTFAATAGQFSAAQSRTNGGRLPWMPISRLPRPLQEVVLDLDINEVTDPLPMQGAVALFQMRGLREVAGREPDYAAIEYVTYFLPGGRSPETLSTAAKVLTRADTCDDFYGIAKDQPAEVLERHSLPPAEIPRDIALELAKLDPNETSIALTRNDGQALMVLMLCGRTATLPSDEDDARTAVANALTQKRLNELSDSFLAQLKADARINEK